MPSTTTQHIRFGFCLPIFASPGNLHFLTPNYATLDPLLTLASGQTADALGYDSLWVADHLMLGKDEAILEGWTTIAALASSTHNALLGLIHQSNALRYPSMTAKMSATLDQLSNGRLIHFFDLGNNQREQQAYGVFWHEAIAERIAYMDEAIDLTVTLWTATDPVDYQGRFHQLDQAVCQPQPLQTPHPPIWIGEVNPNMLEICARRAQGWNTVPVSLEELDRRLAMLGNACQNVGRTLTDLELSLETQILIAPNYNILRQRLQQMLDLGSEPNTDTALQAFLDGTSDILPDSLTERYLVGTPEEIEARIRLYCAKGISHFMLWFMDMPQDDGLQLFAEQVMPKFR